MSFARAELMSEALSQHAQNPIGLQGRVLNPYQTGVIHATAESWLYSYKGVVKAPTGEGKTVMQAAVIEGTKLVEPDAKTLVIVPRVHLLSQTIAEYRNWIQDLNATIYYGRKKDLSGNVNLTVYPSFVLGMARGDIDPSNYKLVLYDEAHHLMPASRVRASEQFSDAMQIGFTATPAYGKNRHLRDVLPYEIVNTSIRESVESDRLCSYSVFIVKTGVSLDEVKVKLGVDEKDFDESSLSKVVNKPARNQAAVDIYKQMFLGKQAVSYCAGVAHAEALAQLFNENGIKAGFISSYQTDKTQREVLEKYKRGEIQVICNADILIEGFNDVKTSVILNLRPTLSPRLAEQRGGRALRLDRDDLGKYAFIIDFIDEISGRNQPVSFAQVSEAAQLVNTWHQHKKGQHLGLEQAILDLKGSRIITDEKEVMLVANELANAGFRVSPDWRTLRRVSAETGIPLDVLEFIADQMESLDTKIIETVRDLSTPNGNAIRYHLISDVYCMAQDVIMARGFTNSRLDNPPGFLTREQKSYFERISRMTRGVDMQHLDRYSQKLAAVLDKDPEKYWGVSYD